MNVSSTLSVQLTLQVALGVLLLDAFALVVELLASCQRDEQLGAALRIDEQFHGDDGEAAFLDFVLQLVPIIVFYPLKQSKLSLLNYVISLVMSILLFVRCAAKSLLGRF